MLILRALYKDAPRQNIYIYEIVLFLENQISKKSLREALNLILKILGFLKKSEESC